MWFNDHMKKLSNSSLAASDTPDDADLLASAALAASRALGLKNAQLAAILGVSEPTLSRIRRGNYGIPDGKPFELALLLVRIYRALYAIVGGDSDAMHHWVAAANRHLSGQSPAELMQSVEGIAQVLHYLDAMRGSA